MEIGNQQITDSANIAEAFNEHFSTIGSKLIVDVSPAKSFLEYLPTTNSVVSIKPTHHQNLRKFLSPTLYFITFLSEAVNTSSTNFNEIGCFIAQNIILEKFKYAAKKANLFATAKVLIKI